MTLQDLKDLLNHKPYNSKQLIFTLGYKKFRIHEIDWPIEGNADPIELKLEEVKE